MNYKPSWKSGIPPIGSVVYGLFEEDTYDDSLPFVVKIKVEQHESKYGLEGKLIRYIRYIFLDYCDEDYIQQDETLIMWRYVTF